MRTMQITTSSQAGFREAARYLFVMRLAIVVAEVMLLVISWHLGLLRSGGEAITTSVMTALLAALASLWLHRWPPRRPWPVTLSLVLDLLLLGLWLSFTGGYTNPLTALLLVPLAMAIILVPISHSLLLAAGGGLIYALLMRWYAPVIPLGGAHHLAQLHLQGMWVAFMITAVILLVVGGMLVRRLQAQQAVLVRVRENRLRDEQIIALGLSAATVAHRIGTPLNSMMLLIEEMRAQPQAQPLAEDLRVLDEQLAVCSGHLRQLSHTASQARASRLETIALADWMRRLRESATLLWPEADITWAFPQEEIAVAVDATLDQAVLNILANGLRASPHYVRLYGGRNEDGVTLSIKDRGQGPDDWGSHRPGEDVSESASGLGIGLFLSNATVQRLGGELRASIGEDGTTMTIVLPEARHAE